MVKKTFVMVAVLISLVMAVPLHAKGPKFGKVIPPAGTLTDAEIGHISYIREEEKLARDVYLMLNEKYQASIFENISESEQRHMDAIRKLIIKYGLEDPVEDDTVGAFSDYFSVLYNELVAKGNQNYCEALQVGIAIEELDIEDIIEALKDVKANNVRRVFHNLLSGSYNHLSAFTRQYGANCQ